MNPNSEITLFICYLKVPNEPDEKSGTALNTSQKGIVTKEIKNQILCCSFHVHPTHIHVIPASRRELCFGMLHNIQVTKIVSSPQKLQNIWSTVISGSLCSEMHLETKSE